MVLKIYFPQFCDFFENEDFHGEKVVVRGWIWGCEKIRVCRGERRVPSRLFIQKQFRIIVNDKIAHTHGYARIKKNTLTEKAVCLPVTITKARLKSLVNFASCHFSNLAA